MVVSGDKADMEQLLKTLQSGKIFDNAEEYGLRCSRDSQVGGSVGYVKTQLGSYREIEDCAKKITQAWCYASDVSDGDVLYGERCDLLYYMVKEIISGSQYTNSLNDIINKVYEAIGMILLIDGCDVQKHSVSWQWLKEKKEILHYMYNYETLKSYKGQDSESSCDEKYNSYIDNIKTACAKVNDYCTTGGGGKTNGDPFCTWFNKDENKEKCGEKLLELKDLQCKSLPEDSISSSSNATPVAISGVITTIGLPAFVFFLYKYNLLPSWISNKIKSNGGGRKARKKRTTLGSDFDLTSATYSTEMNSTIGSSTMGSSLTVGSMDESTIYNSGRRPRPRPPPKPSPQRSNKPTTKNVAYHPMQN